MGMAKGVEVFFLLMMVLIIGLGKSNAAVYRVGDSAGWTNVGRVDYRTWSSQKTFHVGDIIMFEYNRQFQNVVRVTHRNFNACNATGAYETFSSGNDSFVVRRTGHFYFICSVPGHCQSGQKVDIRVPGNSPPSPTPSPIVANPPPPPPPPPPPASQPPRIFPSPTPHPSPVNPPSSQPPPPQSPGPSASPPPPVPQPVPSTPTTPSPISTPPSSPSYQPIASPPMNYEAPAPSPTSGSSFIYFSQGLILMSAFSLLFWMEW